jgi:beta-aspartyl-peptidase (threonine type)
MSILGKAPVIVASENGRRGAVEAMHLMRNGGSALDAVELACRIVEDDPEEHSVGYGGLPNVVGQVELDASIMDGRTLETGAVAAVRSYGNAITLARRVMEELPHVLLSGRGAEQLAAELNHSPTNQLTEAALRRWRERYEEYGLNPETPTELRKVAKKLTRPVNLRDMPVQKEVLAVGEDRTGVAENGKDDTLGTVNFLALDQHRNMASAVSTSGLAWKYPGRVGDSPIIGAGNYCDNRYGAVACTGMGELAIRVSTARSIILYLKMGLSLDEAGMEALHDLNVLNAGSGQYMNIVTLAPDGSHQGFTTVPGKKYLYESAGMDEPALADRLMLTEV